MSCAAAERSAEHAVSLLRRELLLASLCTVASAAGAEETELALADPPLPAPVPATFETLSDATLAYAFDYPTSTPTGRQLSWVKTREPSR